MKWSLMDSLTSSLSFAIGSLGDLSAYGPVTPSLRNTTVLNVSAHPRRNHWSGHSRWLDRFAGYGSSSHIQENDENKLCVLDLLTPDTRWIWEPYKYWYPEKDFYVISSSEHPPTAHCCSNIVAFHTRALILRAFGQKCQTLNTASTWYYTCSLATCLLLLLSCELYLIQSAIRHLPHSWLRRVCLRVGPGMCGALPLRLKAQSSPRRCARTRAGCFYSAHSLRTNQWAQALRASSSARKHQPPLSTQLPRVWFAATFCSAWDRTGW